MSVKFNTPFGAINVSPETGWRKDLYSFDADNIAEAIKKGLEEKLPMIATGSLEPYITIMIDADSDGKGHDRVTGSVLRCKVLKSRYNSHIVW